MKNLNFILLTFFFLAFSCGPKNDSKSTDNQSVSEVMEEVQEMEELTVVLDSTKMKIDKKEKELEAILNEIDF